MLNRRSVTITFKPVFNFATLNKHLQRFGAKMVKLCNTGAELLEEILDAGDKHVVINLFADCCPPCRIMPPEVEKLAVEEKDVVFLRVNINVNTEAAELFAAALTTETEIPTFIFIKDGALKGEAKLDKLQETINKHK